MEVGGKGTEKGLSGTGSLTRPEHPPAPQPQPGPTSPATSPCTPPCRGPPRGSTAPPGAAITVHAGWLGPSGAGGLAVAAGAACRLPGDRPPRVAQVPVQRRDLARPHLQLLPCKGMGCEGAPYSAEPNQGGLERPHLGSPIPCTMMCSFAQGWKPLSPSSPGGRVCNLMANPRNQEGKPQMNMVWVKFSGKINHC